MEKTLSAIVAESVESDFVHQGAVVLPSYNELAEHYRVSLSTIVRAACILEEKGLVEKHKGRRMRTRTGQSNPSPCLKRLGSSSDRLREILMMGISDGTYPSGRPLPKLAYLAAEYRVSEHTVLAAFRALERAGLAYKEGRTWRAGASEAGSAERSIRSNGVILMLIEKSSAWRGIFLNRRTEGFYRSFRSECDRHRIILRPVVANADAGSSTMIVAGKDAVMSEAEQLRRQLLGVLIAIPGDRIGVVKDWMDALTGFGRPVVWFDSHDRGPRNLSRSKHFVRCYSSESIAVERVITYVYKQGHRRVAYAEPRGCVWAQNRFRQLQATAAKKYPDLEVSRFVYDNPAEISRSTTRLRSTLSTIAASRSASIRSVWDQVIKRLRRSGAVITEEQALNYCIESIPREGGAFQSEMSPLRSIIRAHVLMEQIITETEITALVAPSDDYAIDYYMWLSLTDRHAQLSLISFDNRWLPHPYSLPITTLDFGFDTLGFRAFHSILGDIPVSYGDGHTIVAEPRVVVRS